MSLLSRQKGKRGEREWRDRLRDAGFEASRGQQHSGSPDSPDVVCKELDYIHFEVKIGKNPPIVKALAQARRDNPKKWPVVATRRDGESKFTVTMDDELFLWLVKQTRRSD